jgi:MoxR-like ATPase
MTNRNQLYTGTLSREQLEPRERSFRKGEFVPPDPYLPNDQLIKAIQFAQTLGKPLLLKGEPGSGKTRVAEAIAYELFGSAYKDYYLEWPVKSTSKAREGLYTINYLQRLQDANIPDYKEEKRSLDIILHDDKLAGNYIELGQFGKAFRLTNLMDPSLPPPVVLIDEIDKADIDFPNDLLLELERLEFTIPEAKDQAGKEVVVSADKNRKPLIIITSNNEKPLPAAFLRRCLFHYIEFPGPEALLKIVKSRNFNQVPANGLQAACRLFSSVRYAIEQEGTATKNISTSELLDWIFLIDFYYRANGSLFDIQDKASVLAFLNLYSSALAKDEATKLMLEDLKASGTFITNVIDKYNKYTQEPEKQ